MTHSYSICTMYIEYYLVMAVWPVRILTTLFYVAVLYEYLLYMVCSYTILYCCIDMFASCRSRSEFSPRGTSRGLDDLLDTRDNQPHTHLDREDIMLSSDAAMFRSTYASDSHITTALAGRNRRYSSGSEDSTYKNELHPIPPLPVTTVSEQVEYKNTTSERISNSMEFNSHSYIQEDSVNLTILSSMALADDKRSGYREPPKELLLSENDNIKECDEDEDCKTGYSTMYSVRD